MRQAGLYSFDIFDTLITRRVATPVGIFAIMQYKIANETNLPQFIKDNFFRIRVETEKLVRKCMSRKFQYEEITIDEIYETIKNDYNLTVEEIEFLKNLEIATEINNIVPIKENISKLKELVANGERVVLISDIYLPLEIIRKILVNIDSIFQNVKIYLSSEYRLKKSKGNLYLKVQEEEQAVFENWIHTGDNKNGDIKQANNLGIRTKHYAPPALMPYEKYLLDNNKDNVFSQANVGSARLARFEVCDAHQDKYCFGASFAGPILYNYMDYVIQQSLIRNFKTLYFVARDGYILKLIADMIISKKNLNIKTKYIYGSRLAWKVPTEDNFDEFVDRIFEAYGPYCTVSNLARSFGSSVEILGKYFNEFDFDKKLDSETKDLYLQKIKNDNSFRKMLIKENMSKKQLILDYFRQEINFLEKDFAFVDLTGTGRTQDFLADLLNEIEPCNVIFFYFTNYVMCQKERSKKICYGIYRQKCYWLELLGRAVHGQTLGYQNINNKIVPILEKGIEDVMQAWGFNEYAKGICEYTSNMLEIEMNNFMSFSTLNIYNIYYDYMLNHLDRKNAEIIGSIPFSLYGEEVLDAARPYHFGRLLLEYLFPIFKSEELFTFVSVARSSRNVKNFMAFKKKYPCFKDFLFCININKPQRKASIRILGLKISLKHFYRLLVK